MRIRGRREFGALVLLIVLLLGVLTTLPMGAMGASNQITGIISDSVNRSVISGATVSLIDANGYYPTLTTTTAGDGVYVFTPNPGSYNLAVKKSGYYANGTTTPIRFDGTVTKRQDVWLDPTPTLDKLVQLTVVDDVTSGVISGAVVEAYYVPRAQVVANGTTSATGQVNLTLWTGTFQLRTNATGYMTNVASIDTGAITVMTIRMQVGGVVQGHAISTSGQFLSVGLVGFLYSGTRLRSDAYKIVLATVIGSFYQFHAPVGDTYIMVVDAKGYSAFRTTVTVTAGPPLTRDATLALSANETVATTFVYKAAADWSNLTIYRNTTLNADSFLQNLNPPNLRDLRLQVDYSLGDGDGVIDVPAENDAFHAWLVANGPFYVTTDGNFTTNGKAYISDPASYIVTVQALSTAGSKVWINTSATYSLKQAPPYITPGAKTYSVNVTLLPDTNVSVYQDFNYTIALPRWYELNTTTLIPSNASVAIKSFAPAVLDPGTVPPKKAAPQAKLVISQSLTGTARAKVVAPAGKFYVQNATFTNYQAFVAGNTTLTFSAEDSTDPNGHIAQANFTWKFTPSAQDIRYNIRTDFKYTQNGPFIVNLTVKEAGGNTTFRDITIWVDDQLPVANIKTNRTGSGSANNANLTVDENIPVRFDGGLSTDLAYPGKNGVVLDGGYSWDFNGDRIADATGRIVNWTFRKPGQFTVNLTVTDSVGWKSTNASMTAIVNDTKAPVPAFDILDPSKDWGTITSPMERKTYSFNASRTTDDHDKYNYSGGPGLNVTWTIPGPIVGMTGTNHTFYGVNVTFAWQEWNSSYTVRLAVKDTGFGSNKPNTGYLNRSVQVQTDTSLHADLKIEANTLKLNPGDPEEFAQMTVTVNVTNKASRAAAGNVTTQVLSISGGQTTVVATQADWFDKNGNPKGSRSIASGETVTLVFHVALSGQGNKTLQVYVYDSSEPYTWITSENRASLPVNVRQPAWQPYAIYGSVIGIIALFVFGMYARRKVKAGEWRPLRGRREKGGEEKEKPRREIKEEKKRL